MKKAVLIFIILSLLVINGFSQDGAKAFFYIPSEEEMKDFLGMKNYLTDWDLDKRYVDEKAIEALFSNYIGKDNLLSLLFETFLRNSRNKKVQKTVLNYFENKKINTSFTDSLKKLYNSEQIEARQDGKIIARYVYNDALYDEGINLFNFYEAQIFNNELGFLLFDNDYGQFTINKGNESSIYLIYGGGTNSLSIGFTKYIDVSEEQIVEKLKIDFHKKKYNGKWTIKYFENEGVLNRSGASKYIIAFGTGNDTIDGIHSGTFISYLYNEKQKVLYEINTYMNFSTININFEERYRIYNYILFFSFFAFLN